MLGLFANLPRPVQALVLVGGLVGIGSGVMAFVPGGFQRLFMWIAIGVVLVVILLLLFRGVLWLRSRSKSKPFAEALARGGRGTADPAQKARMDDLRKKFEDGVTTFKAAGKDLYSLPWFLLAGPPGSGKTEALRHCNVGFPPGLQDPLQGAGGTLNMHWWFTNHSVVLDTAGRMFMTEDDPEWKSFMKLLKTARPRCPINGLLLVISSESLLKDSSEKIEQTAGVIARQLDVIQRTLDVRFPVSVIVTKCDKIVGFREFFETITQPDVQHQILGWSNPAQLDEKFDPASVDKHLETVRQRLIRRRFGLLQNPVHTEDPNARRTDQVDELFELPDNLVRIAPRLRRYLEMIFVAGEWSPKPLFLRGIYFTSSMREGQALDVSLAQALGIDVDSIPGDKEWDKEKSYFLRDVFMAKVFREKGLVTRAVNVSKSIRRQRTALIATSMAATVILGGLVALGVFTFKSSLKGPADFWRAARVAFLGDDREGLDPVDLRLFADGPNGEPVFRGTERLDSEVLDEEIDTPVTFLKRTAERANTPVETPTIAKPVGGFLGFGDSFLEPQRAAHRRIFEHAALAPLVDQARSKLQNEKTWGPEAVAALAELVRLQTFAHGQTPDVDGSLAGAIKGALEDGGRDTRKKAEPRAAIDADALARYVLGGDEAVGTGYFSRDYRNSRNELALAVSRAYPDSTFGGDGPAALLQGDEARSVQVVDDAATNLVESLANPESGSDTDMGRLNALLTALQAFDAAEKDLQQFSWLRAPRAGDAPADPTTGEDYERFAEGARERLASLKKAKGQVDEAAGKLGASIDDPMGLFAKARAESIARAKSAAQRLIEQLPTSPSSMGEGLIADAAKKAEAADPRRRLLRDLRDRLTAAQATIETQLGAKLDAKESELRGVAPLVAMGNRDREERRAYEVRWSMADRAGNSLEQGVPEATAGRVSLLAADLRSIDDSSKSDLDDIASWGAWEARRDAKLDADQRRALTDGGVEARRVHTRIVELAAAKRRQEAVLAAIARWPRDDRGVEALVKSLADERVGTEDPDLALRRLKAPPVPMTPLASEEEFRREYHIDAAKLVMQDYAGLRALVRPANNAKPTLLGAKEIEERADYRAMEGVTRRYAERFIEYWRNEALGTATPSVPAWADFAAALPRVNIIDLRDTLRDLRTNVQQAFDATPPMLRPPTFDRTKTETLDQFAGVDSDAFMSDLRSQLDRWRRVAQQAAPDARRDIVDVWMNGQASKEYFAAFQPAGRGIKWWNDAQLLGLELLRKATAGDDPFGLIVATGKGVPLVICPDATPDLTPDQVRQVADAARRLAVRGTGGALRSPTADSALDQDVNTKLRLLSGRSALDDNRKMLEWFERVSEVADAVGKEKAFGVMVQHSRSQPPPARGGGPAAADQFGYAKLFVGGQAVGEAFNLSQPLDAERARRLRIPVPLPAGQGAEIQLFKEDPATNPNAQPASTIPMPGVWSVLRSGLVEGGEYRANDGGGWRVVVSNGTHYLWLDVTFDQDARLPARDRWPTWSEWPKP
ncbi:MAG: type VI secretion protein IcmF/TssM N-terminal domain-containing protein [Planctomycetota bacterium]|nr:type VI secretion protein IcmF/TssM N-terminal domain-containing protein [Planctomycetota bacterium]